MNRTPPIRLTGEQNPELAADRPSGAGSAESRIAGGNFPPIQEGTAKPQARDGGVVEADQPEVSVTRETHIEDHVRRAAKPRARWPLHPGMALCPGSARRRERTGPLRRMRKHPLPLSPSAPILRRRDPDPLLRRQNCHFQPKMTRSNGRSQPKRKNHCREDRDIAPSRRRATR